HLETMKRITLALAFFVALFFLASTLTPPIKADIFDDYGTLLASGPYILFPDNTTYTSRNITLNISFSTKLFSPIHLSATYSLDGTPNINVPLVSSPSMIWNKNRVIGSVNLPELSDGSHKLSVYVEARWGTGSSYWDSEIVYFTVQTTTPKIKTLSPINQTYTETNVPFMFTVNKANWIGYSLDGQENNTISGNFTLNGLPNGLHNVTVYANDTYGNMGASETISFTVAVAEPESFPVVLGIAVSFTVALVVVGLFVYYKRKSKTI
ncbi:MAG TPA: hypothetical protein VF350_05565, partial [Candidatus Bathyarchaeia archaeon]